MVGFPGETQEDFLDTVKFAEKIGFEKIHIFPYSRRSGTAADKMDGQLPRAVKAERVSALSETADSIRCEFLKNQIGKTLSVLIEGKEKGGMMFGYTPNYTPVQVENGGEIGLIADVLITGVGEDCCIGKII